MNWYNYLKNLGYPVVGITVTGKGLPLLQCSELGDFKKVISLERQLRTDGISVQFGPVKGSWAEAHWEQLLTIVGSEPDNLPW